MPALGAWLLQGVSAQIASAGLENLNAASQYITTYPSGAGQFQPQAFSSSVNQPYILTRGPLTVTTCPANSVRSRLLQALNAACVCMLIASLSNCVIAAMRP